VVCGRSDTDELTLPAWRTPGRGCWACVITSVLLTPSIPWAWCSAARDADLESGSLWEGGGMGMQDYRSLLAAVMICATLVNTHTHTQGQFLTGCTISSDSWAKKLNRWWNCWPHLAPHGFPLVLKSAEI